MPPRPQAWGAIPLVTYAKIAGLRARHDITVVTLTDESPEEQAAIEGLRTLGVEVHALRRESAPPRGSYWRLAARWCTRAWPRRSVWLWEPKLQPVLDRLLAHRPFDLINVEDSAMGMYGYGTGTPRVFTEYEVVRRGELLRAAREAGLQVRGAVSVVDGFRWPRYQRRVWRGFDRIQVLTPDDREAAARIAPELRDRLRVVPYGVIAPEASAAGREEPGRVLFVGSFMHPPNVDAVHWLVDDIMPILRKAVPGVRLTVVGDDPRGHLAGLAGPDVHLTGFVPEIDPYVERAAVVIAPVRLGGGQRMKVLQSHGDGKGGRHHVLRRRGPGGRRRGAARDHRGRPDRSRRGHRRAARLAGHAGGAGRARPRVRPRAPQRAGLRPPDGGAVRRGASRVETRGRVVSRAGTAVPILMYHLVTPRADARFSKYSVSAAAFARQMDWLARRGYTPVSLDAVVERGGTGPALPDRPVVITFDDGFQACVEHAVPLLVARGFTATFYLVAGLVGRTSRWLEQERGLDLPLLDWPTARALEQGGFQCGAHSLTHPRLATLPRNECARELEESKRVLENELGHAVHHLAYPFGSYDAEVQGMARAAGYRSACSVRIGLSSADDERYALHRVPVLGSDTLTDFVCRLRTSLPLRETVSRAAHDALRRLRGAESR